MKQFFLLLVLVLLCAGGALAQPAAPAVSGNATLCNGASTVLTASGQTGALIRWWGTPTGNSAPLANTAIYNTGSLATGTYNYYVDQTVGGFASARTGVVVNVYAYPTISFSPAGLTLCYGSVAVLTATGANSYAWSTGSITDTIQVSPGANTTYTVTGTSNGCSTVANAPVTVNRTVTQHVVNVCPGSSVTLTASGATSYVWSPGGQTTSSITVTPSTQTTYTVTGTQGSCVTSDTASVSIYASSIGLAAMPDNAVTAGTIANLTATSTSATSYVWNPNQGNSTVLSGNSVSVVPTQTTPYVVTATDANGCQAKDTVVVTVNNLPEVGGGSTVCYGAATALTASGTAPFTWYIAATGGSPVYTGATFTTPALTASTSYWVSANGGPRKEVSLFVPPSLVSAVSATPSTVCAGTQSLLSATYSGVVKWYDAPTGGNLVGSALPGASLSVTPGATKTYYAEATPVEQTATFNYTGAVQTWTVPAGVTSVNIDAYGSNSTVYQSSGNYRGKGGRVQGTMNVTPGQVLNIYVGGQNHWNGGAYYGYNAGGDATDIRINGTALVNRVLVAGGGGSSGPANPPVAGTNRGNGGGLTGQDGGEPGGMPYDRIGRGGSQTVGGSTSCHLSATYPGVYCGTPGVFGQGGIGYFLVGIGGSGGGGWYGGSGGTSNGGGGGSSYTNPQLLSNVIHTQGAWDAVGTLYITWGTSCTSPTRTPVIVTVNPSADFTTNLPANSAVCEGQALSFSPVATSATGYQWSKSGTPITGATTASYNITAAAIADSGQYRLVAYGALGCNDTTATALVVNAMPTAAVTTTGALCVGAASPGVLFTGSGASSPYTFSYKINGGAVQTATTPLPSVRYVRITQNLNDCFNLSEVRAIEAGTGVNVAAGKTVTSSGAASSNPASNLTDGNLTNMFHSVGCSTGSWVEIDLGASYNLSEIKIVNRQDCCQNRAANLQLTLKDAATTVVSSQQVNAYQGQNTNYISSHPIVAPSTYTLAGPATTVPSTTQYTLVSVTSAAGCTGASASSATVMVSEPAVISLEPAATLSLCTGSSLSLSVTASNATGYQWLKNGTAIAGATGSSYSVASAATADSGIYRVVAFGAGSCNDTSTASVVSVGAPATAVVTGGNFCVGAPGTAVTFNGSGGSGTYTYSYTYNNGAAQTITGGGSAATRYVRVQQNAADWFHLSEIRVIQAGTGVNVAAGKTVTSSTMNSGSGASLATDGDATTYFHSSTANAGNYVEIDLGASYEISQIQMVNRPNCCWDRAANLQLILKDNTATVVSSRQVNAWQNQNSNYQTSFAASAIAIPSFPVSTAATGSYTYNLISVTNGGCTVPLNITSTTTVHTPADILFGIPATQSICAENPLTLGITASNATGYKWLRDSTVLTGATTDVYGVLSTTAADGGLYKAIALGSGGCNDTAIGQVTVNAATAGITGAATVCTGSGATNLVIAPTGGIAPYTYTYNINGGASQTVATAANSVRYIRVQQNASLNLHLAEITATALGSSTNIALGKPVTVLSTLSGFVGSNLTNGNTNDFYHSGAANSSQYAEIDLGQEYNIGQITIRNRADCCWNQAANLQLILKNGAGTQVSSQAINAYQGQNSGFVTTYPFSDIYKTSIVAPNNVAGTYQYNLVSVSSANGCTSTIPSSAVVTVGNPAVITTELPATAAGCLGTPLVQTIVASNAVSYQWRKNGVSISGATGASYTIASSALSDTGVYTVIAYGTGCNDTSVASTVKINTLPTATVTGTATVCTGAPATVTLAGGGASGPYTFLYNINGGASQTVTTASLPTRYIRITQNVADWMNIAEVQAIQAGTGTNLAAGKTVTSSGASSGNPEANLTDGILSNVWHSSVMTVGSWVEIDLGQEYNLSAIKIANRADCCQSRLANLQLTLKNGAGIQISSQQIDAYQGQNSGFISNHAISIPTSEVVSVNTATPGTKQYNLVSVSSVNGCTSTATGAAVVAVQQSAAITTDLAAATQACAGSPVTLSAPVTNATAMQWQKGGVNITGATTATYSLTAPAVADAGVYRLIASGVGGCNDTTTTSLAVGALPTASVTTYRDSSCQGLYNDLIMTASGAKAPFPFTYTVDGGAAQTITAGTTAARYVRIRSNGDFLIVGELEVYAVGNPTNLALGKPIAAVSTKSGQPATYANDGIYTNYYQSNAATINQLIEVDLGQVYDISHVKITTGNCSNCQLPMQNFLLQLTTVPNTYSYQYQLNAWQGQNYSYTSTFYIPKDTTATVYASLSSLPVGTHQIQVTSVASGAGCISALSVAKTVVINPPPVLTVPVQNKSVCAGNPVTVSVGVSNATTYRWRYNYVEIPGATGASYVVPIASAATSGVYDVLVYGLTGCGDVFSSGTVAVTPMATSLVPVAATATTAQPDGLSLTYTSASCEPIATVTDSVGGNLLGTTTASIVIDAAVQTFNGAPYLQRHFDITPASNGPATVKLYATQAEFNAFNSYVTANGNLWPKLPTGPADATGIANISVAQFHGLPSAGTTGPGGQYNAAQKQLIPNSSITSIWNGSYWTMSFPVTGFSGFFITSGNGNTALAITLTGIRARNTGAHNLVEWTSASEEPGDYYEVERSTDGRQFGKIGTVEGVAPKGTDYSFTDEHPAPGLNYYRLQLHSAGGAPGTYTKTVTARVAATEGFAIEAFPNPASSTMKVRLLGTISGTGTLTLTDVAGRVVRSEPVDGTAAVQALDLEGLAPGTYLLRYIDAARKLSLKVTKE